MKALVLFVIINILYVFVSSYLATVKVIEFKHVIFNGHMGLGITVKTDVTDLCRGDQIHHSVHHAQTCTQDRYDGQLLACQDLALCSCNGSLHHYFLRRQISGCLIAHEAGNLADQLPEFLHTGILVTQNSQLVLNEGMV